MRLLLAFLFSCTILPIAHAEDWPAFLGPRGDSTSSEKGILSPWPEKGLKVVWHRKTGVGYAPPTVTQGKLLLFDRTLKNARLVCLNASTGEEVWKFEYPSIYRDQFGYNNGPRCAPIVDGDRIYLHGVEGMLHCLNFRDGSEVWKVDTKADFGFVQNFFGVGSTPIVEGDLLIVQIGGSPANSDARDFQELKGNGTGVVAFEKRTGKIRYKLTDELASYSSPVVATIEGRRWCFLFARGGLLGFNPADGKLDFQFPWRSPDLESVNASNPVVVGNEVLISETYGPGGALLKVKPSSPPQVVWDDHKKFRKSLQAHWMTPIHHEGFVYASSGRHTANAELRCIEWATGKVQWSEPRLTRSSLLMVDAHFVCLGEDGTLRLLKVNPKKLEEVSTMEVRDPKTNEALLDYPCWAAPVLSNGLMYVRGENRIVCLELIPKR